MGVFDKSDTRMGLSTIMVRLLYESTFARYIGRANMVFTLFAKGRPVKSCTSVKPGRLPNQELSKSRISQEDCVRRGNIRFTAWPKKKVR